MRFDTGFFTALVFGAVGLALSGVALASLQASRELGRTAERTFGTVVRLEVDGSDASAPVVEFTTAAGETAQVQGTVFSKPPDFAVGDEVQVLVPPGRPQEAVIDSFTQRWLLPAIFGAMGIIFLAISGAMLGVRARDAARRRGWDAGPSEAEDDGRALLARLSAGPGPAPSAWRVAGLLLTPVAVLLLGIGGYAALAARDFEARAVPAKGTVVKLTVSRRSLAAPVVEFTARDGQVVRFGTGTASNPPQYAVGQGVDVLYLPERPREAQLASAAARWMLPGALLAMGLLFAGFAAALLRLARAEGRAPLEP